MSHIEHKAVMEWDRPGEGLYADGSIRIITSRLADGRVGSCHQASAEEVRWVLLMESKKSTCADLLEYLWQHGWLKREDAVHFDKTWGDGTVGNRPWKKP